MTTHDDVRKIARKLPGAVEGQDRFGFSVEVKGKLKGFCWSWLERVDPKKARVVNDKVLAVSTPGLSAKEMLIEADPVKFFTEPHYNGYPAVLVRLEQIDPDELEELLVEAWKTKAPKALQDQYSG